jgi:hypothetical protein
MHLLNYPDVYVSDYPPHLLYVLRLSRAVGFVLEAESDCGLAAVLVSKHLEPARIPKIHRPLNILDAVVSFAASGHLRDLLEQFPACPG